VSFIGQSSEEFSRKLMYNQLVAQPLLSLSETSPRSHEGKKDHKDFPLFF